jgi:hypothetical protein
MTAGSRAGGPVAALRSASGATNPTEAPDRQCLSKPLRRASSWCSGGRQRGLSEQSERPAIITATRYCEQQLGVNKIARRLRLATFTL